VRTHHLIYTALLAGTAAIAIPALAQRSPDSGPVARYDMRAGTTSGIGGMGAMNPMALMFGGADSKVQHELLLRLGSSSGPDKGKPKADHFMPSSAQLGKSVALTTPRTGESDPVDVLPGEVRGRILLYWGCGDHAPKGQPVVIDLASIARGQVPQGVFTTSLPRDLGPSTSNSTTFGHWPSEDGKYVKSNSSLLGAHRIAGNYSPEIAFTLSKDFMAPLSVTAAAQQSGATLLNWQAIPDTTGQIVTLIGGKQSPDGEMGDMVMWTSSATQQFGGALSDWLSPGQVAPLVKNKTLLAPDVTTCTVPAEVTRDTPDYRFGTLTAFGPDENFSYPPRPDDANAPWNLQWTARIRHRSTTSWMEAQGMSMGTANDSLSEGPEASRPECKPKRGGMFSAIAGGLLGGGSGNGC